MKKSTWISGEHLERIFRGQRDGGLVRLDEVTAELLAECGEEGRPVIEAWSASMAELIRDSYEHSIAKALEHANRPWHRN